MFKKYVKYWSKLKKLKTRMFVNFSSEINGPIWDCFFETQKRF